MLNFVKLPTYKRSFLSKHSPLISTPALQCPRFLLRFCKSCLHWRPHTPPQVSNSLQQQKKSTLFNTSSTNTYPDKNQNVQCVKNVIPKSPASAGSSTPRTPPPSTLCQLRISFRNSDFKDENNEVKYLKLAKELKVYHVNVMHISIDDLHAFNLNLSENIRNDYLGLFSSLCSELKTFMKEEVGDTSGRDI